MIITDLTSDQFYISISSSNNGFLVQATASMVSGSSNYLGKILNTDPTAFTTSGYYLRDVYNYAVKKLSAGNAVFTSASHAVVTDFTFGYNSGSTPWIKSQLFGGYGGVEYNLFRVHTLGHGEVENGRFKISIRNVRQSAAPSVSGFGKFDLEVRTFNDTDKNRNIVESFPNLSLDPKDPSFIMRAIGDKYFLYDQTNAKMVERGDYDNRSKLIRIEFATASFPNQALPWGYRGMVKPDLTISGSRTGHSQIGSSRSSFGF